MDNQKEWNPPSDSPVLAGDEVHVWRITLRQPVSLTRRLAQFLNAEESARASRFHFPEHRERFIVGRSVFKIILGAYLNEDGANINFKYSDYGKPLLAGRHAGSELSFNLAHSNDVAVYAITLSRRIGIDIEYVRPDLADDRIAERFFAPAEVAVIRALPPENRTEAFFNCWTRKEAYIKARGEGMSLPLDSFTVSLKPGEPAALLTVANSREEGSRWSLSELVPAQGYVAAIAVEGHGWKLRGWDGNELLADMT